MRSWVKSQFVLGLVVGSVALSAQARADTPAPAAPAAAASAPDIVRLKNGGMLRGTIAESEPGQSVTIVLLTGETRKIAAADVSYAGPANAAPSAAAPPPAATAPATPPAVSADENGKGNAQPFAVVHAAEARVDFVSEPDGNTLFRRSGSAGFKGGTMAVAGYDEVCTAPCNASMPSGTHTFAIARSGGNPLEADPISLPPGTSTLKGTYKSHLGTRVGLIVGAVLAAAGGVGLQANAIQPGEEPAIDPTGFAAGTVLEVAGVVAFICVAAGVASDSVDLSITPGVPTASNAPRSTAARFMDAPRSNAEAARDGFSGLTVTARF